VTRLLSLPLVLGANKIIFCYTTYKKNERNTKQQKREKMRALSEGGEARANPPSGTRNNKTTMRGL